MLQILRPMIDILFEDAQIVAVSKPSGQVVIPGRGELLGVPLVTEASQQMGRKVFVVHRLDRGVSGVVLFAKDAKTHRDLSMQFENRSVKKSYVVLVQGVVPGNGHVDQPIQPFGSGRMGIHANGKPSLTAYEIRERLKGATLLNVMPETGRRHQIRVHLYSIGHPVMGDPLYGKERPVGGASRLMLHAAKLDFARPDGKRLVIEAKIPEDFKTILSHYQT